MWRRGLKMVNPQGQCWFPYKFGKLILLFRLLSWYYCQEKKKKKDNHCVYIGNFLKYRVLGMRTILKCHG